MKVPQTPISELDSRATLEDVIAKINEVIQSINEMWNPNDGS